MVPPSRPPCLSWIGCAIGVVMFCAKFEFARVLVQEGRYSEARELSNEALAEASSSQAFELELRLQRARMEEAAGAPRASAYQALQAVASYSSP